MTKPTAPRNTFAMIEPHERNERPNAAVLK